MKIKQAIEQYCQDTEESLLFLDGFDDAIIGMGNKFTEGSVVYSKKKIIEKLCEDMSYDEAFEYYDFNIAGAYLGKNTPFIIDDLIQEETN